MPFRVEIISVKQSTKRNIEEENNLCIGVVWLSLISVTLRMLYCYMIYD